MALKPSKVKKKELGAEKQGVEKELPNPRPLLSWYDRHRRIMPWRALRGEKPDPYRVWLSEIMLQQTTVATVGPYFQKFVKRWPTLKELAAAPLDDILRMWAGLGYYRRARLLHQCAQSLWETHKGVFPSDEKTLLGLPGFGPYTAAAVAAIAFDRPANVVDGNVERVMARLFAIQEPLPKAKTQLRAVAAKLVPQKRCGDYAQALMDLGATICTPRSPKCGLCPWQNSCQAHAKGIEEALPRRAKAQPKPTRRAVAFVLLNQKGEIFLRRRPSKGLLADMMEVPSSPWQEKAASLAAALPHAPTKAGWKTCPGQVVHVFTHFTFEITVAVAQTSRALPGRWIAADNMAGEALPSVMKKIILHALKAL